MKVCKMGKMIYIGFVFMFLCKTNSYAQIQDNHLLSVTDFLVMIDSTKGLIIDVRTPSEFNKGTINGAINIDYYNNDFVEKIEQLDKSKFIYLFCRSGVRSGKAMKLFIDRGGYENVYELKDGYNALNNLNKTE